MKELDYRLATNTNVTVRRKFIFRYNNKYTIKLNRFC